jgi:hypothetical protein
MHFLTEAEAVEAGRREGNLGSAGEHQGKVSTNETLYTTA